VLSCGYPLSKRVLGALPRLVTEGAFVRGATSRAAATERAFGPATSGPALPRSTTVSAFRPATHRAFVSFAAVVRLHVRSSCVFKVSKGGFLEWTKFITAGKEFSRAKPLHPSVLHEDGSPRNAV
jgi:hypothetical protein